MNQLDRRDHRRPRRQDHAEVPDVGGWPGARLVFAREGRETVTSAGSAGPHLGGTGWTGRLLFCSARRGYGSPYCPCDTSIVETPTSARSRRHERDSPACDRRHRNGDNLIVRSSASSVPRGRPSPGALHSQRRADRVGDRPSFTAMGRDTAWVDDQDPNHRARRVAPNAAFSAAYSREGSWGSASGDSPRRKLTSTLLTSPPPNSA